VITRPPQQISTDRGVACVRCGYDVRGLSEDGHCPECGHPVVESAHVARLGRRDALPLHYADRRWLACTAAGLALLSAGMVVPYALWALAYFVLDVQDTRGLIALADVPVTAAGALLVVLPRERRTRAAAGLSLRLTTLLSIAATSLFLIRLHLMSGPRRGSALSLVVASWATLVATVLLFRHLSILARRMRSRSYEVQAHVIVWLILIGVLALPLWRVIQQPRELGAWGLYGYVFKPPFLGLGDPYFAVELVSAALRRFWFGFPWPAGSAPFQIALLCSVAAVWAAALHASLAYSLWRIRRRQNSPGPVTSPVPELPARR
jgi:hypothetical protein